MILNEQMQIILIAILGSSGLWSFLTIFMQRRMEHRLKNNKQNELRDKATLAILHQMIYQTCERYIIRGCITADELETLNDMYLPYKEMGGNGTGKIMMERVVKLDLVTEEERSRRLDAQILHDLNTAHLGVYKKKKELEESTNGE